MTKEELKDYIDIRIRITEGHLAELRKEQEKWLTAMEEAANKAVKLASDSVSQRLEAHNNILGEMKELKATFATIIALDSVKERLDRVSLVVEKKEGSWQLITAAVTGIISLIGVLALAFFTYFKD